MITGEERLREFLARLYGDVVDYEGRPSEAQLLRAEGLARELADVKQQFERWRTEILTPINALLASRKLPQIASGPQTRGSEPQ